MPTAAIVPRMTAMRLDSTATVSVVVSACMISVSRKSSRYQSSVKPPHLARDLFALNEKMIKTTIGAYKNRKMKTL